MRLVPYTKRKQLETAIRTTAARIMGSLSIVEEGVGAHRRADESDPRDRLRPVPARPLHVLPGGSPERFRRTVEESGKETPWQPRPHFRTIGGGDLAELREVLGDAP